jgi:lipid-A-disaccharide synthase
MKYYIIAGERSGDLHGSNLIKAIKQHDLNADIRAWGGGMMQESGAEVVKHYRDISFMGLFTVIRNLPTILRLIRFCKKDILSFKPDAVILIDYAGFNMRIAKFTKQNNIQNFYYISPKVWAWNQSRALKIKSFVDKLFVIFPFEVSFFQKYNYPVEYVGNPLMDAIEGFVPDKHFLKNQRLGSKPIIALLPGSRKQEVEEMLPIMLSQVYEFPDYQFVVGGVSNLPRELYLRWQSLFQFKMVYDDAYNLLSNSEAALVTSGTATLETALLNIPQVVCYKAGRLSYEIGKRVIKIPFISLVNLVAEKEVVKELIQNDFNQERLKKELSAIISGGENRPIMFEEYLKIKETIGEKGASERVGKAIVEILREKN